MANLLLDHPWSLVEAINPASNGFEVLETFDALLKNRHGLFPIPFIALEDYLELCRLIEGDPEIRSTVTSFKVLVEPYVCWIQAESDLTASPDPEPGGPTLSGSWRRALGRAMQNSEDWRNPQIVVGERNIARWHASNETSVRFADGRAFVRVLAVVEDYDAHPFAIPDFDPWDLRKYDPNPLGDRHPCRLPRPAGVDLSSIVGIQNSLERVRQRGWRSSGRYWYIPPQNWDLTAVDKAHWRNGRAFPQQQGPGFKGPRALDYEGRVWVWDHSETQWDVQEGDSYYRISERGVLLPRSPLW